MKKHLKTFVFFIAVLLFTPPLNKAEVGTKRTTMQLTEQTKIDSSKTSPLKKSSTEKKSFFSLNNMFSKEGSYFYILLMAFLTGILASFTPCIYPMIPITVGILQAQASTSLFHNFLTATSYVIGISAVYSTFGYLAATTTLMFGQWMANPWLIFFLILLFLYFAFSMFGFYEIYIPTFLRGQEGVRPKGSLIYSFFFGVLSGSAASPCLTPALALLLGFVAKQASPLLGFLTLFAFSLGMGTLLILIGTFSSSALVPRAGNWMIEIKKIFGFALIGVCVYFLQPFFAQKTIIMLYSLIAFFAAGYYFFIKPKSFLKAILGIISLILAIILLYGILR